MYGDEKYERGHFLNISAWQNLYKADSDIVSVFQTFSNKIIIKLA